MPNNHESIVTHKVSVLLFTCTDIEAMFLDGVLMGDTAAVTAADIARLAGVSRGTVSNWRRRHADFPTPVGGTDASPAYGRREVEEWLSGRGMLLELSLSEQLWRAVMNKVGEESLGEVVTRTARLIVDQADSASDEKRARTGIGTKAGNEEIRRTVVTALAAQSPAETVGALLDRYAETAGISATPHPVAELMAYLGAAHLGMVFDPAAGTGELLVAALDRNSDIDAIGQELDADLARLAELNMYCGFPAAELHGLEIATGDSLRDDKFAGLRAHTVLCHPPFGDRDWGHDELAHDPRWEYGIPPKSEPELAWIQHSLSHLEPGGRAVMLLPPAVAARPAGRRIRAQLLRRGALRAVISLPAGTVRPRHVPVHLWVLERSGGREPADPRVLLVEGSAVSAGVDAVGAWTDFRAKVMAAWQSYAGESPEDLAYPDSSVVQVEELGSWLPFAGAEDVPGHWRIIRVIDLLDEVVDLSPSRHVASADAAVPPTETLDDVLELSRKLRAALGAAAGGLPADDWVIGDREQSWRTVTVHELARSKMAEYYPGAGKSGHISAHDGDVLVPASTVGPPCAAVIEAVGNLQGEVPLDGSAHLIRPDPEVLDPWFLAGFLSAPANLKQASYGTSAIRIDVRRLSIPLLPLERQRVYGMIFRQLRDLDAAIAEVASLAGDLTGLLARSLADGMLLPPVGRGVMQGEEAAE